MSPQEQRKQRLWTREEITSSSGITSEDLSVSNTVNTSTNGTNLTNHPTHGTHTNNTTTTESCTQTHKDDNVQPWMLEDRITNSSTQDSSSPSPWLFIIRHGDRWDYQHPEWKTTARRRGDPPLSPLGHEQARQVGQYLGQLLASQNMNASDDITVLSSPFLRTVQTANEILGEITKKHTSTTNTNSSGSSSSAWNPAKDEECIQILPEYSIFELDLLGQQDLHASLPDLEERKCYFPRLDTNYRSMFVPDLPEDQEIFFERCRRVMDRISQEFGMAAYEDQQCHASLFDENENGDGQRLQEHQEQQQQSRRVMILVTHAACCIGLVKAATGLELEDINPAAPCSIYKLTRATSSSSTSASNNSTTENHTTDSLWEIDHCSKVDGFNGFTGHMNDLGTKTIPWNHFGDKNVDHGYTGPPSYRSW